jgi:hypothetical protein
MTTYAHNTIVAMLKELFEARSDNPHPDWLGALWDSFPEIGAQQVIDAGDALRILLAGC